MANGAMRIYQYDNCHHHLKKFDRVSFNVSFCLDQSSTCLFPEVCAVLLSFVFGFRRHVGATNEQQRAHTVNAESQIPLASNNLIVYVKCSKHASVGGTRLKAIKLAVMSEPRKLKQ